MLKRIAACVFRAYDWCYLRYYGLNRENARAGNLILFHLVRHSGDSIMLSDGTCVGRGDSIIVIHIRQSRAREMQKLVGQEELAGVKLVPDFMNSLHELALKIKNNPVYREVRAIRGDTLLGPVARHFFGFDACPDNTWGALRCWLGRANARTLIASARKARTGEKNAVDLKNRTLWTIWMSQKTLMSQYPPPTV